MSVEHVWKQEWGHVGLCVCVLESDAKVISVKPSETGHCNSVTNLRTECWVEGPTCPFKKVGALFYNTISHRETSLFWVFISELGNLSLFTLHGNFGYWQRGFLWQNPGQHCPTPEPGEGVSAIFVNVTPGVAIQWLASLKVFSLAIPVHTLMVSFHPSPSGCFPWAYVGKL